MTTNAHASSTKIVSHAARVGDLHFSYLLAGSGEPLLLLHGFPQHSHMWRRLMPVLSSRFTVIAPDQRGAGGSSRPATGYDKRTMASDIYGLVHDVLGFDRINLLGYDQGAGTAYAYAAAHPEQVRRLVFVEFALAGFGYEEALTPKRGWEQRWQVAAFSVPDVAERFISGRERDLLAWYFQTNCANPEAVAREDFEIYVRALQRPGALRAGFNYFAAVWDDAEQNRESVAKKGKLKMPVLLIEGERAAGPWRLQGYQQVAENLQHIVMKDASHWLVEEQPDAFTEVLLAFLAESREGKGI